MCCYFSYKHILNEHIESVHEGKKSFKCNICYTAFSQKRDLSKHMESVHKGRSLSNVIFEMLIFLKKKIWILNQFIKERSHSHATFMMLLFLKKEIWLSVPEEKKILKIYVSQMWPILQFWVCSHLSSHEFYFHIYLYSTLTVLCLTTVTWICMLNLFMKKKKTLKCDISNEEIF